MEEQKGGTALAHPAVNLYLCRSGIQTLRPHHHPCAPPHSLQKMISYSYYIYNKVWRPIVRLLRFRHRCGYGIHSPFAWAKVTGVIYERGLYYAYAPLLTAHPMGGGRHDGMTLGDLRLLFRLSNDTHPRRGHIVIRKGLAAPAAYLPKERLQVVPMDHGGQRKAHPARGRGPRLRLSGRARSMARPGPAGRGAVERWRCASHPRHPPQSRRPRRLAPPASPTTGPRHLRPLRVWPSICRATPKQGGLPHQLLSQCRSISPSAPSSPIL